MKKFIALVLCTVMMASSVYAGEFITRKEAVELLFDSLFHTEESDFRLEDAFCVHPDSNAPHAHFVKSLYLESGYPVFFEMVYQVSGKNFTDVSIEEMDIYMILATHLGIVYGYPDGSFQGENFITQKELLSIFLNGDNAVTLFEDEDTALILAQKWGLNPDEINDFVTKTEFDIVTERIGLEEERAVMGYLYKPALSSEECIESFINALTYGQGYAQYFLLSRDLQEKLFGEYGELYGYDPIVLQDIDAELNVSVLNENTYQITLSVPEYEGFSLDFIVTTEVEEGSYKIADIELIAE